MILMLCKAADPCRKKLTEPCSSVVKGLRDIGGFAAGHLSGGEEKRTLIGDLTIGNRPRVCEDGMPS